MKKIPVVRRGNEKRRIDDYKIKVKFEKEGVLVSIRNRKKH